MAGGASGRFEDAGETRPLGRGTAAILHLVDATVGRATMEPGWRWSEDLKPIVGGDSCQAHHIGYVLSGSMHIVTDGGEELDVTEGDAYEILPGHDAWVTGDGSYQALEFQKKTAETFAKPD
jgi:mannose-6-phosphate isomerase-like protein (cupin superfamily)